MSTIRETLLALQSRDLALRSELAADGSLYEGYHPRMEAIHRENAKALLEIIDKHGWPNEILADPDGAEAAWLIAQHSIGDPDFMRLCRVLLFDGAMSGLVPFWQFAYIDDRIRILVGNPQRYGTQIDQTPNGPIVCETEEPEILEERRKHIGLEPIEKRLAELADETRPTPEEYQKRKEAERLWRIKVGWDRSSED